MALNNIQIYDFEDKRTFVRGYESNTVPAVGQFVVFPISDNEIVKYKVESVEHRIQSDIVELWCTKIQ